MNHLCIYIIFIIYHEIQFHKLDIEFLRFHLLIIKLKSSLQFFYNKYNLFYVLIRYFFIIYLFRLLLFINIIVSYSIFIKYIICKKYDLINTIRVYYMQTYSDLFSNTIKLLRKKYFL